MCIAIISTAHPKYKLILIDNRDEFLNRPTAEASWWPRDPGVYGPRDLLRSVQGTWLGVTKTGKIAVLTNYKEPFVNPNATSRGEIIKNFLTDDHGTTEDFVKSVVDSGTAKDAGGFSLVCGVVGERLAVVSNRAEPGSQVPWIAGDTVQTVGLSNAAFETRTWHKVLLGEEMMLSAMRESEAVGETEDAFIERLLALLSHDTLSREGDLAEGGLETYSLQLRNTILVPPLGRRAKTTLDGDMLRSSNNDERITVLDEGAKINAQQLGFDGVYATQKQTVVLVDHDFKVRYFERTLFDEKSVRVEHGKGDIDTTFMIQPM
jgi:uncharacterized protein with NRDE domain